MKNKQNLSIDREELIQYYIKDKQRYATGYHKKLEKINEILFHLNLPQEGKIVMLGTCGGEIFNKWCDHFGKIRCIGYDIDPYGQKPSTNIRIKDIHNFDKSDNFSVSLSLNDLPCKDRWSFKQQAFYEGQKWELKNVITGGYVLTWSDFTYVNTEGYKNFLTYETYKKNGFLKILQKDIFSIYLRIKKPMFLKT